MEYWRDRAIDKGIGEASAMLEALLDDSLLLSVACHIEGCDSTWTGLDADDPLVEVENRIATTIADLGIGLIARCSRSNLVFLQRAQRILGDCWQLESNGQCSRGDNLQFPPRYQ